jgi:hypothetical protein
MQMHEVNFLCHGSVVAVSFVASILGLMLLWEGKDAKNDEKEETEKILFRMSFSYWLVYCVAFGLEKMVFPNYEPMMMTLKITTALSYFLTFSCILSLPLHRFAVRQEVQD